MGCPVSQELRFARARPADNQLGSLRPSDPLGPFSRSYDPAGMWIERASLHQGVFLKPEEGSGGDMELDRTADRAGMSRPGLDPVDGDSGFRHPLHYFPALGGVGFDLAMYHLAFHRYQPMRGV